jgi:hypothetical protein
LYALFISPISATCVVHHILPDLVILVICGDQHKWILS